MDIPTTHEILLLRLMLCAIVLFFGATYAITLFNYSFFCVSDICSEYFRTLSVWNREIVFLRRFYSWLPFFLQRNLSCLSLYAFPSSNSRVLKHHYTLQLSWLFIMFLRGILLASLNSSIYFFPLFFIMYPQSFLILRASALVHPHCWALSLLTIEKMCLSTNFMRWEGSAINDGSDISSSSFPLGVFRTWPQTTIKGCLSTARIVIPLSVTTIEQCKLCSIILW